MRVTEKQVSEAIKAVAYINMDAAVQGQNLIDEDSLDDLKRMTQCIIVMQNGFIVTGESVCVDLADFDSELGQEYAYKAALDKVYTVLGYENRTRMVEQAEAAELVASLNEDGCEGCKI